MGKHADLVKVSIADVAMLARKESWARAHFRAWGEMGDFLSHRHPIVTMILACADYADAYEKRYESRLGDDHILGEAWKDAMWAIRRLLNGELGGLDGGTLDSLLCRMLEAEGFET